MNRREFLKMAGYALLSLPLFSFLAKFKKEKMQESPRDPHEAMYYKNLAG